ncbi:MAG TPA: hypothetical protein VME01_06425 [Solirubrobacteraceae bacterium]|nr:hypothetical protein [Solirubrobacteraceae bacterium]
MVHVRGVGGGSDTCADGGTPYQDMLATAPNAAALDRSLLSSGVVTGESEVTYLRKLGVRRALALRLAARWYREHNISSSGAPGT